MTNARKLELAMWLMPIIVAALCMAYIAFFIRGLQDEIVVLRAQISSACARRRGDPQKDPGLTREPSERGRPGDGVNEGKEGPLARDRHPITQPACFPRGAVAGRFTAMRRILIASLAAATLSLALAACTKPQFLAVVTAADAACQEIALLDVTGSVHKLCLVYDGIANLLEQALAAQRTGTPLVVVVRKAGGAEERIEASQAGLVTFVEHLTAAKATAAPRAGACK
jgi:hypothetical protein